MKWGECGRKCHLRYPTLDSVHNEMMLSQKQTEVRLWKLYFSSQVASALFGRPYEGLDRTERCLPNLCGEQQSRWGSPSGMGCGLWSRDRLKWVGPARGGGRQSSGDCWGLGAWEGAGGGERGAESWMMPSAESLVPKVVLSSQHRQKWLLLFNFKRCLLLGRKVMTNLDSILKSRDKKNKQRHYFANKGLSGQGYGFSSGHVWMWELDCEERWAQKNWCFWTVVL